MWSVGAIEPPSFGSVLLSLTLSDCPRWTRTVLDVEFSHVHVVFVQNVCDYVYVVCIYLYKAYFFIIY
jgi:hypothetical protein